VKSVQHYVDRTVSNCRYILPCLPMYVIFVGYLFSPFPDRQEQWSTVSAGGKLIARTRTTRDRFWSCGRNVGLGLRRRMLRLTGVVGRRSKNP
jgi:hypothetical protein